jgi:hypothetical protein
MYTYIVIRKRYRIYVSFYLLLFYYYPLFIYYIEDSIVCYALISRAYMLSYKEHSVSVVLIEKESITIEHRRLNYLICSLVVCSYGVVNT